MSQISLSLRGMSYVCIFVFFGSISFSFISIVFFSNALLSALFQTVISCNCKFFVRRILVLLLFRVIFIADNRYSFSSSNQFHLHSFDKFIVVVNNLDKTQKKIAEFHADVKTEQYLLTD